MQVATTHFRYVNMIRKTQVMNMLSHVLINSNDDKHLTVENSRINFMKENENIANMNPGY